MIADPRRAGHALVAFMHEYLARPAEHDQRSEGRRVLTRCLICLTKLAHMGGGRLIVDVLSGDLPPAVPQPDDGVTYASKLDRVEGRIDWTQDAADLGRRVRALNPWPGVWC